MSIRTNYIGNVNMLYMQNISCQNCFRYYVNQVIFTTLLEYNISWFNMFKMSLLINTHVSIVATDDKDHIDIYLWHNSMTYTYKMPIAQGCKVKGQE